MNLGDLSDRIGSFLKNGDKIILTIDGMAAAGKSTFAALLKELYSANIITMDHFFLRPSQRTPERLASPGGNIDYERFTSDVLVPLLSFQPFSYRPFDCAALQLSEPVNIFPKQLIVIEGVYSYMCMYIKAAECGIVDVTCDDTRHTSIFMKIDKTAQQNRLLKRNLSLYDNFTNQWLPMENMYFKHFDVEKKCDYIIDATFEAV